MSKSVVYAADDDLSAVIPADSTPPQKTEGTEILSLPFAAESVDDEIEVLFFAWGQHKTSNAGLTAALFVDDEQYARATSVVNPAAVGHVVGLFLLYTFVPGDTDTHVLRIRAGGAAGVIKLNSHGGGSPAYGGTAHARLRWTVL